jgi:hypothetical protein
MYPNWKQRIGKQGISWYCHLCSSQRVKGKVVTKTVGYLGSISENPTKPERELFWAQVLANLKRYELSVAERGKIEAKIAHKVPRGKNPHGDSDAPVEWYTPYEHIEKAREVLGDIDLDPASNALAQSWIQAGTYYTADQDGMIQPWFGRVWCNPPYSKEQPKGRKAPDWLEKALSCYENGEIEAAIVLLNRTGAAWYRQKKKRASAICEAWKRIQFLDATGTPRKGSTYHNDFWYLGPHPEKFAAVFRSIGDVRDGAGNSFSM